MNRRLYERVKRKIVACREELRMCEERAQEAENMEARADRNGLQLQIDWQDAELDLQVTQDDLDAAEFIIPSLERMNPVEDVKAELLEMLLQGGARWSQVEAGRHLNMLLVSLLQRERRKEKHLIYFRELKQESLVDVAKLKSEMSILYKNRVSKVSVMTE